MTTPTKREKLVELAEQIAEAGVAAARSTRNPAPWYHNARTDMAHAANCFAVAAALRAQAKEANDGPR